MAASKKPSHKVGEVVEVPEGATVRRPDGTEVTVSDGLYVLSMVGTYQVNGDELEAK